MKFDILPAGWKFWQVIVFGLLASIGFKLADPIIGFLMEALRKVTA
jgi:hypothetical protein